MLQQHPHHQDVLQSPCASGQTRYFAGPNGQLMAALPPAGYSTYDCYGTMQIPYQQDGSGHAGNMQYMGMHQPAQAPRLASSSYGRLPGSRPKARGSRLRKLAALLSNPVAYMPQNFTTMLPLAALYPQSGSLDMQHQQKYQTALDHGRREARAVQAAEQPTMHVQRHSACRQGPLVQFTDRELHVDTNPLFPFIPHRKRSMPSSDRPSSRAAGLAGWAAMPGGDRSIHLGLQPQGMQNSQPPVSRTLTARSGAQLHKKKKWGRPGSVSDNEDDARVCEPEEDEKELYNRLGQSEEAMGGEDDQNGDSEGADAAQLEAKFDFDLEDSDEEGCTAGYAGDRRMRKPKTRVCIQASLMPLLVSDAVEDEEQFIQVKGYCPYGFFEGRLRDVGNFRKRSESQV